MANGSERLVYQIDVTDPGSRSQGWHGTLYDKNGHAVQAAPGKIVHTDIGDFLSVAKTDPWVPHGMIHVDQVAWMKTNDGNVSIGDQAWSHRLFVAHEGTKSEGWRGELLYRHGIIGQPSDGKPQPTQMGPYHWLNGKEPWQPKGWFHVSWSTVHKTA
jgi:hypothetical protein